MQVGTGMEWISHTATEEMSLKKCLCIMAAEVQKHLDTGTQRREAIISQSPHA